MEVQDLEQRIRSLGEAIREQEDFYRSMSQFVRQAYQQESDSPKHSLSSAKSAQVLQIS